MRVISFNEQILNPNHSILQLHNFIFQTHLGVTESERIVAQEIALNAELEFPALPKACESDAVTDLICYEHLSQVVQNKVSTCSFVSIEALTFALWHSIIAHCPYDSKLTLAITKTKPPIQTPNGGVTFKMVGRGLRPATK
jgi:FolB domain-containing protein